MSKVKPFLLYISLYLRGKKEQAQALLEFIEKKKSFKRKSLSQGFSSAPLGEEEIKFREEIWNRIRAMNSKGRYSRSLKGGDAHGTH